MFKFEWKFELHNLKTTCQIISKPKYIILIKKIRTRIE